MYKKVSTDLNFVKREEEILEFWNEKEIFKKSVEKNKDKPAYTFYDGPPTANGKPHIGHVLTRCYKDIIPRYQYMKGHNVLRKAGWDTHGLPVELEVEKMLGLDGKKQIEEYGVEDFIQKCKESVWKYKGEWEKMSERVGFWVDMEHPYVTYENDYIESIWWALKKISDQGLLYKGIKTVPYCPRCETSLSSHEVAQGYKDVVDTSAIVKFKAVDEDYYFLAWTTTPWTLPSNSALCVNGDETYCLAERDNEKFVLAETLLETVLPGAQIIKTCKGSDLVGKRYQPLFECTKNALSESDQQKAFRVIADSYVTTEDGSGIVHVAPGFGEDDARVGQLNGVPTIQLVDNRGQMRGGTPWDGLFVKDADKEILKALEEQGSLLEAKPYEHNYPFCWRCDTPLIYYGRSSWFIKVTAVKDKLIEFNRSVNWLPENIKEGRMGNFLENVIDWGISRERYWGTPLPVWKCDECGHFHTVGSIAELREMSDNVPEDIELHKPYIDAVKLNCPKCSAKMTREPEVIDCWFDSGSMPFAQWHYPFENQDNFSERYPANFICEAVDQTRGWFYTLLAISSLIMDKPAFENCIVLGHVQDQDGKKMSKHLGNVVDPWSVLDAQGADAVRWYFFTSSMPWLPSRFGPENVSESQRKFMGTYWNTYAFYILYAEIDKFDPTKYTLNKEDLTKMDFWVLSRLNSVIKYVDKCLEELKITEAGRELQSFIDDVSNWYVRRGRERYWGSEMTKDKVAAYMTLYTVLDKFSKVCAPFVPFISENIYQNMVKSVDKDAPESIHLCDFPVADESFIDADLEKHMQSVLEVVVLARACRNVSAIKNRQPLATLYIKGKELPKEYCEIVEQELNVKRVEIIEDASAFTTYALKPQLRTLGPKYGKMLGKISAFLKEVDGNEVMAVVNSGNNYEFEIDATLVSLSKDDILSELTQKPGFVAQSDNNITVVIDTNLTDELKEEGFYREIISKIQTMRKEAGFDVVDHIQVGSSDNKKIADLLEKFSSEICAEVLSDEIVKEMNDSFYTKRWDINGESVVLGVNKK